MLEFRANYRNLEESHECRLCRKEEETTEADQVNVLKAEEDKMVDNCLVPVMEYGKWVTTMIGCTLMEDKSTRAWKTALKRDVYRYLFMDREENEIMKICYQ